MVVEVEEQNEKESTSRSPLSARASLETRVGRLEDYVTKFKQDINALDTKIRANKSSADKGIKYANDRITAVQNRLKNLESWQSAQKSWNSLFSSKVYSLQNWQTQQKNWNSSFSSKVYSLQNWQSQQKELNSKYGNRISSLETWQTQQKELNNTVSKKIVALQDWRDDQKELNNTFGKKISALQDWRDDQKELNNTFGKNISSLKEWQKQQKDWNAMMGLSNVNIRKRLDALEKSVNSWSDAAIIAAIALSDSHNTGLWDAENYDGGSVGKNDGKAVRLFKVQFQGLKTHFAGIMRNYFDMDDKDSAIYRLRYSIVAGFEETKDLLDEWLLYILEALNNTNTHLDAVNTWLKLQNEWFEDCYEVYCTITDWLKLIYEKSGTIVSIPPVIIPEKENGWIKTLIETVGNVIEAAINTLGNVLEAAIGEVGQLLRDLLNFLDGLINDLMRLVVPENLDFMDKKFESTSKTIKLKFGSIFDGIDAFKAMFGSKSVFKDIEINLGSFGNGSFKLPMSLLNDMAPFVKALITGAVALEFLIDMYKWFHTKGEVIE